MPYDVYDGLNLPTPVAMSFRFAAPGKEASEPSDAFVPHVEPEDDRVVRRPNGELNLAALGALINRQASDLGVPHLLELQEPAERLSVPVSLIETLLEAKEKPDLLRPSLEALKGQLGARRAKPVLPIDTSVNVYTQLRQLFDDERLPARVDLAQRNWPVVTSSDRGIGAATADLARYYNVKRPHDARHTEAAPPARLEPQDRNELREALDDLRADSGGKIVNLYNDWRMWMAWLAAGNPILGLARLGDALRDGNPDEVSGEAPFFFKHAFIVAGYEVEAHHCDGESIQDVARKIGLGQRGILEVPVTYLVRNSWNRDWGPQRNGTIGLTYKKFHNLFRDAYGLMLGDKITPPR